MFYILMNIKRSLTLVKCTLHAKNYLQYGHIHNHSRACTRISDLLRCILVCQTRLGARVIEPRTTHFLHLADGHTAKM